MIRRYPLASFVILTYLITWPLQIIAYGVATGGDFELSNEDNFGLFGDLLRGDISGDGALALALFNLGQIGPVAAAFVMATLVYGSLGSRDLLSRCLRWRVESFWYLAVLLVPLGLVAVSLIAAFVTDGLSLGPFDPDVAWVGALPFLLYMIVFTGITEEPGWRGFALPHAQAQGNAWRASWIVGVAWGIWHVPFTVYFNRDEPWLLIPSMVGLTVGIVGWTVVNTWIYNGSRSVLLIILLHGWNGTVQSMLVLSQPNFFAQTVYTLLPWGMAIWLARRYGEEHLGTEPRPVWWPSRYPRETRLPDVSAPVSAAPAASVAE